MEPQMIDHYNEFPNSVNVIDKMNDELSETQNENEKLKRESEKKNKELKLISLYTHYCNSHPDNYLLDDGDLEIEITDSKLEWFHKYSHLMKELNIADMDHWVSEYWGWINYNLCDYPEYSDEEGVLSPRERKFEMLADEAVDFEINLREKAKSVIEKYFDPEHKTRLYSWGEVMDSNYMD